MISISNPTYDVVFKYMMADNAIAKIVASSILGMEVVKLEPRPQEHVVEKVEKYDPATGKMVTFTVHRLDFSAKIKTPRGYKLVLIEMQKASTSPDIMRYRGYLAKQYANPDNVEDAVSGIKPLQIYCIYFLGKGLGFSKQPVLEVDPLVREGPAREIVDHDSVFINSLTHRTWIIQIDCLKERRRNDAEQLLAVFDQSFRSDGDHHILNIRKEDFPKKYWPVIRRLQMAASNPEIKRKMRQEDEDLQYLMNLERGAHYEGLVEGRAEGRAEGKAERDRLEADLQAKNAELAQKATQTALKLQQKGMSPEDISEITGLTLQQISSLT